MNSTSAKSKQKYLELLEHLYDALHADIGIVIRTDNIELTRQKLYAIRKAFTPEFDGLSFLVSPDDLKTELWIIKNAPNSG